MAKMQSAERVSQRDSSDNYVFQRSQLAYHKAAEIVSGNILEIGTGSGYGVSIVSPQVDSFLTIDKFDSGVDFSAYKNVAFRKMTVPPLAGVENSSFDCVIMFQVIEHIKDDFKMLSEIVRVLRPGGKLIITTPNRKTSLTRNPWHIREYTPDQFTNLLRSLFSEVQTLGVFGKQNVLEYYEENRRSVEKIAKYDIFKFQKWLPNNLLRIPYNILNRINRRKLLSKNPELTTQIKMSDYFLDTVNDSCFDLFYIAQKTRSVPDLLRTM